MTDHHREAHQGDTWRQIGEVAARIVGGIHDPSRRSRQRGGTEGSEEERADAALEAHGVGK